MIRRGREGKGKEGKGRGEGKFGAEKIAAIYSANFGGASQTRGRGGVGRQRQLDAFKTFLWKNNVMPTSSYL